MPDLSCLGPHSKPLKAITRTEAMQSTFVLKGKKMETKHGLNCYECGKAYESKRSTSKYCSGVCRKLAAQKDKVSVPANPLDTRERWPVSIGIKDI